jgi:membrane-bound lytic murein transglycosylase B
MDREIDVPPVASGALFEPTRRAPARMLVHLAVIAAAALPLLALVTWGIVAALQSEQGEVAAPPRPQHVRVGRVVPFRSTAQRSVRTSPDVFAQESHMTRAELVNRWSDDIERNSRRFGVPQSWIRAVMVAESGGRTMSAKDHPITSVAGAVGVMQLMPATYAEMREEYGLGPDPYEPRDNIVAGAAYLRWLFLKYGYPTMFAAYNDGPGNLEQRLIDGRMLPLETQLYIASVTGSPTSLVRVGGARSLARFTRPDGGEVDINGFAVSSVRAPFPGEYAPGVNAVIDMGKLHQGVRESVTVATAVLRKHGGRV